MVESFDKCYLISRAGELLNVTRRTGALEGKEEGGGGGVLRYTGEEDSKWPNPITLY